LVNTDILGKRRPIFLSIGTGRKIINPVIRYGRSRVVVFFRSTDMTRPGNGQVRAGSDTEFALPFVAALQFAL